MAPHGHHLFNDQQQKQWVGGGKWELVVVKKIKHRSLNENRRRNEKENQNNTEGIMNGELQHPHQAYDNSQIWEISNVRWPTLVEYIEVAMKIPSTFQLPWQQEE